MQELFSDPRACLALAALIGLVFVVGRWVGEVNSDRKSFKEFMAEVRKDIREILDRLPSKVASNVSPIRLTELGKRVSEGIGARQLAGELAQRLLSRLEDRRPHEISRLCTEYVNETFEPTAEQRDRFLAAAPRRSCWERFDRRDEFLHVLVTDTPTMEVAPW